MVDEIDKYHREYVSRAERIPQMMRDCGLIGTSAIIDGRDIEGSLMAKEIHINQDGTVKIWLKLGWDSKLSEKMPITALDRLLEATFAYKEGVFPYEKKHNLDYMPLAMKTLNGVLSEIERDCENYKSIKSTHDSF